MASQNAHISASLQEFRAVRAHSHDVNVRQRGGGGGGVRYALRSTIVLRAIVDGLPIVDLHFS